MKKLLSLTLALLMAVMLFGVSGARNLAYAEEENPYLGLWEITGYQEGDTYAPYADTGSRAYMEFMANGIIYGVMVNESGAGPVYMGYKITGENTLDVYEGEDPLPAVYDPETGVITVTDTEGGLITFVERVKDDPLPDIRALVEPSDQEQTYYGYLMTQGDQTINMLEVLPTLGMDPEDFYLTLNPDGTGYMQFGNEEAGGEITWTETELTAEGQSVPYTRVGDHIVIDMGESEGSIEFAPEEEVEVLMVLMGGVEVAEPVDVEAEDIVGEWKLLKASYAGQDLSAEQIKEMGLEMSFIFNEDGTASMTSNDSTTDGLTWAVKDGKLSLTMYGYELFDLSFDGEHLILNMMANLYFEKIG